MENQRENKRKKIAAGACVLLGALLVICAAFFLRILKAAQEMRTSSEENGRILAVNVKERAMAAPPARPEGGIVTAGTGAADSVEQEEDYAEKCGLDRVERPRQRSRREVLARLRELAEDSGLIAEILEHRADYPDRLLEALANNPEMADFVSRWNGPEEKASGGVSDREKKQEFPLFLQWDPRWGYVEYGDESCIALSGCGPTCLSMALYYLTDDERITPDRVADYSMENGYYIAGTGTAWALMEAMAGEYGIECRQPGVSEDGIREALEEGAIVLLSMGPGEFTAAGHFIVVYGYDEDGYLVNDPNCVARSRKQWSYAELEREIKNVWVLSNGGTGYHHGAAEAQARSVR